MDAKIKSHNKPTLAWLRKWTSLLWNVLPQKKYTSSNADLVQVTNSYVVVPALRVKKSVNCCRR